MEYKVATMKEVDENMWNEIYHQAMDIMTLFLNKGLLFISFIFGIFLGAIGYPKQIILFILILSLADIATKHFSIAFINYGSLTWEKYIKAWQEKVLTSRQLKNGITVKIILYSFVLYIANQLAVIPGILFGGEISGVIYSLLVFIEVASVLENLIHCGFSNLSPLLNFIKNKQKQITEDKTKV